VVAELLVTGALPGLAAPFTLDRFSRAARQEATCS
jgi:hypothetical protein